MFLPKRIYLRENGMIIPTMKKLQFKVALLANLDFFVNLKFSSSCAEDPTTEKIISIRHLVVEIFYVEEA